MQIQTMPALPALVPRCVALVSEDLFVLIIIIRCGIKRKCLILIFRDINTPFPSHHETN